ncbi:hypothetical protein H7347_04100 [Corynebacterium sp. zg-331]|uniref:hypothetical protein n=1 Tax=unclassified Corynebacterium TaxID=2624378 RepID=UPI00128DB7D7|nr:MULTISPECIES: hypothetical protein [unclassified Corynebacterium]MBC3185761.1 hypothetical protein [Corynebacterium sp. zg-331]MPV52254.1 hypothetical protein [Corynebacterium sp. zg331]
MKRPPILLSCALLLVGAATGCSTQRTVEGESPSATMSMEGIRTPDDPILGAVDEDGTCDAAVLTAADATLVYHGQPGDSIEVTATPAAGAEPTVESFEMSSTETEHRIELGEWSSLDVSASGRVGLPGRCALHR